MFKQAGAAISGKFGFCVEVKGKGLIRGLNFFKN